MGNFDYGRKPFGRFNDSGRNTGGHVSNNSNSNEDIIYNSFVGLTEENYVELAEKAIDALANHKNKKNEPQILTTSKIRNILALNAEIYNDVINESSELLSEDIRGRINYLKVRVLYEAGREPTVKFFVNESHLLENISNIKGQKKQYLLFSRYLEALVAYRKFKYVKDEN